MSLKEVSDIFERATQLCEELADMLSTPKNQSTENLIPQCEALPLPSEDKGKCSLTRSEVQEAIISTTLAGVELGY